MAYAALVGVTVRIINNSNGKLSEAINDMVNALS
jgi:adenylate kinase